MRLVRSRRLVAVAMLSASLVACGGGDSDSSDSTSTTAASAATSANVVKGAEVRLVDLFSNGAAPSDVDIFAGLTAMKPGESQPQKPVRTVKYADPSQYFEPPAINGDSQFSIYPAGKTGEDDRLIQVNQTFTAGEKATILLTAGEPSPENGSIKGQTLVMFEKVADPNNAANALERPAADKALVLANASAVGDADGYNVGIPGKGCLNPAKESMKNVLVGGTSTVGFQVAPDMTSVAFYGYADKSCATPLVGPVQVDAKTGSRFLVLAYGPEAGRKALVLALS